MMDWLCKEHKEQQVAETQHKVGMETRQLLVVVECSGYFSETYTYEVPVYTIGLFKIVLVFVMY